MTLPYNSLITFEQDNWNEYLKKICLYDIFKELLSWLPDPVEFKHGIRYILWAYSLDSDAIVIGMDWHKNKLQIFEKSNLKDIYWEAFGLLKSEVVLNVINSWLEFQDSETFTMLQVLKDLKVEMQLSANSNIKKASLEVDYDQKYKNSQYAMELTKKIKDLEAELIQNIPKMKGIVQEFRTSKQNKSTLGVEKFAL